MAQTKSTQLEMFAGSNQVGSGIDLGVPHGFKPLLSATVKDFDELIFPLIASPKIDGIRCLVDPKQGIISRDLKYIPNAHVRNVLNSYGLSYLDGELVTYTDGELDDFNTIQSKIMSRGGSPTFQYHVFDNFENPKLTYTERLKVLSEDDRLHSNIYVVPVPTFIVHDVDELTALEHEYVNVQGWEGVMLRWGDGIYKYGRSTMKQHILMKVKRFFDSEATIKGTEELMRNANEAKTNALGYQRRSSHQENMVPGGTLGKFICEWEGVEFGLATGLTDKLRDEYWAIKEKLPGMKVNFKFQRRGPNGKPILPVFRGIRYEKV